MDDIMRVGQLILTSALVITVLALVCDIVVLTGRRASVAAVKEKTRVGAPSTEVTGGMKPAHQILPTGLALYGTGFTAIAILLLGGYLGMRAVASGYSPFSNQHEFAVSFVFGILIAYLFAEWRFRIRSLALVVLPVAIGLLVYANSLDVAIKPLVPALKNNLMLTLHVAFAITSYGAACVSFGAAVLYLVHPYLKIRALPSRDVLDDVGYKAASVTFPLLTMMIVLGAVWAKTAWGSYWSWDPKETAALVTWLIYAGYLHARVTRGWQGARSSWLLILGFAAVLFAYFGNHFFGGLHSYGMSA